MLLLFLFLSTDEKSSQTCTSMYVCCMQEVLIKLMFMELIKTLEHKDLFKQASKAIKVKTTNTIILNPVFVHALELKLEKFSELKRAMEQSCLEIHDLNLNRAPLHKRVQISGLRFRGRMPTDGNCMFHAVQDQLQRVHSTEKYSHSELRANTVAYLEAHAFLVRNYIYIYTYLHIYIYIYIYIALTYTYI